MSILLHFVSVITCIDMASLQDTAARTLTCAHVVSPPSSSSRLAQACQYRCLQVYVDASTQAEVWDVLRTAVEEYLADHPESFSGQCAVFCFGAGDPMKLKMGVYFEYSFNGGTPKGYAQVESRGNTSPVVSQAILLTCQQRLRHLVCRATSSASSARWGVDLLFQPLQPRSHHDVCPVQPD